MLTGIRCFALMMALFLRFLSSGRISGIEARRYEQIYQLTDNFSDK